MLHSEDSDCCQLFYGSKGANWQSEKQAMRCDEDLSTRHILQHCKEYSPGCVDIWILVPECRRKHWAYILWCLRVCGDENMTTDKLNKF